MFQDLRAAFPVNDNLQESHMKIKNVAWTVLLLLIANPLIAQRNFSDSETTKVVLLGTGTPNPVPSRSGPSVAIIVNGKPYIIDFGPGLIRRTAEVSHLFSSNGESNVQNVKNIEHAFLTHLHSDHTAGYPDLILSPWVMGRSNPLEVYGPEGLNNMTDHILEAYQPDIRYRVYGTEPANNQGWRVESHEIKQEGKVYKDEKVTVEAFPVPHGNWPNAWGYRFATPDKVIVISGDTAPSKKVTEYAKGVDILIHEVYSKEQFDQRDEVWRNYHSKNHTSTHELGRIATKAKPGLVVLYHTLFWGATNEEILNEISKEYSGKVVVGQDLDIF